MTEAVTFLLTDVEGSTRLWETRPDAMRQINERHDALVDQVVGESGTVFRDRAEGDSSFAAFDDPVVAVIAAVALQRAIETEPWPDGLTVRVRAALHTGRAESRDGQYYGPVVNRGVRLRALAHGGQVVVSEAVASAVDALPDGVQFRDLGTHRLKDLAVPEHVFQVCASGLDDQFPPLRSPDVLRNNLAAATTTFVGRTDEQKSIVDLLRDHRLVTITGSGGVGKTRLAREVAAALIERFADGVWFVDFTAVRSDGGVGRTAVDAIGAKDDPVRTPAEVVAEHLRSTKTLLVLDNCEHLPGAVGALVAGVLPAAPDVRILVTSRQPIGLAGERVWRVPPLGKETALELFVDRVLAVDPARQFDDADRTATEGLCEQLDGIPLAIEMAAARAPEMRTIAALADALQDRLAVSGNAEGPSRQRTMRATIEWSDELLKPGERRLLRRLSAFVGGFTLEAAEGVCADERLDAFDVLGLLSQLVSQSLVQADEDGAEFRYRLLEVVREFAAERLAESPEFDTVQSRHQAWFMQLAEREGAQLYFGAMAGGLDALERELPNLRRAIDWDGDPLEEDVRYRLVAALHRLWALRGYAADGLNAAAKVLETKAVRRGWRSSVLVNAAALAERSALREVAARYYEMAATLSAEIDADIDDWGAELDDEARATHHRSLAGQQAWCLVRQATLDGTTDNAGALASEAVELARVAGGHTLGLVLCGAGEVAFSAGRIEEAASMFAEALPIFASVDARADLAQTHLRLGATEWARGRFKRAADLYREAGAESSAAGDARGVAAAAWSLADVAILTGDETASAQALDAWNQFEALADPRGSVGALVLRVRAGEPHLAEHAVAEARRLHDGESIVEAVMYGVEARPLDPHAAEWLSLADDAAQALPWRRPGVIAARAVVEANPGLLVAASAALDAMPHAIALLDVLRLAARGPFDATLRHAASALLGEVIEGMRICEDGGDAPPLGNWLATLSRFMREASDRGKRGSD